MNFSLSWKLRNKIDLKRTITRLSAGFSSNPKDCTRIHTHTHTHRDTQHVGFQGSFQKNSTLCPLTLHPAKPYTMKPGNPKAVKPCSPRTLKSERPDPKTAEAAHTLVEYSPKGTLKTLTPNALQNHCRILKTLGKSIQITEVPGVGRALAHFAPAGRKRPEDLL